MMYRDLYAKAKEMLPRAYAPFSKFRVGAALLTKEGEVYTGCNVENSSFGATICAERTAFFKALSEGEEEFVKIAIVGGKQELSDCCVPCGLCRQVMTEFCDSEFVILVGTPDDITPYSLETLMPLSFTNENM